ncbi:unannotated protein [freshwater metagenome]|uniref:Unannotated protein n=1 Tax=freshwater metagenome TaxID=449393 RepID=A0A6J6Z599_9ZZZZ
MGSAKRASSAWRTSISRSPDSTRRLSHTSRVEMTSSLARPPDCRRRALRCRRILSTSSITPADSGFSNARASSRTSRREPGPPWMTVRSSGQNVVIATISASSFRDFTLCRLIWVRPRPSRAISASIRISRSSITSSARRIAVVAPFRTIASFGLPRSERPSPR